jgi:hypothetical protein
VLLALINIGLLVDELVALVLELLKLVVCLFLHNHNSFSLLFILLLQLSRLLFVPVNFLQAHLHVSLPPHLPKLVELVDLRVINFDFTEETCAFFVAFVLLGTLRAASPRAHPAVVLTC